MRMPRMNAEGGKHKFGLGVCQIFHHRPIGLAGGIDNAAGDAGGFHRSNERPGVSEARVQEMVVGIGPVAHEPGISNARRVG